MRSFQARGPEKGTLALSTEEGTGPASPPRRQSQAVTLSVGGEIVALPASKDWKLASAAATGDTDPAG